MLLNNSILYPLSRKNKKIIDKLIKKIKPKFATRSVIKLDFLWWGGGGGGGEGEKKRRIKKRCE